MKVEYLSIASVSGFHIPSSGRVLMVLKAYYDGSGKSNSGNAVLTLSGVAATEELWRPFELEWSKALRDNGVSSPWHMADLMCSYDQFLGWDEQRRQRFLKALFNVFGSFRISELRAYSCSVLLADYKKAAQEIPHIPEAEAICVNFCAGGLGIPAPKDGAPIQIVLFFDRGERFMHTINRVWLRLRKKKKLKSWAHQVSNIMPVDSSYYPIQAADMLAWITNSYHRGQDRWGGWQFMSTYLAAEHCVELYDYKRIIEKYGSGSV